jgi:hypothetical protein
VAATGAAVAAVAAIIKMLTSPSSPLDFAAPGHDLHDLPFFLFKISRVKRRFMPPYQNSEG